MDRQLLCCCIPHLCVHLSVCPEAVTGGAPCPLQLAKEIESSMQAQVMVGEFECYMSKNKFQKEIPSDLVH